MILFEAFLTRDWQWLRTFSTPFLKPTPCLFLDRDGTMIEDKHYLKNPADVRLINGCIEFISKARQIGWAIVMISNQSGIARNILSWEDHFNIENHLVSLIEMANIDASLACPNHPSIEGLYGGDHPWRKPNPGMIFAAQKILNLDLASSILVGDKASDIDSAKNADIKKAILVETGYGREEKEKAEIIAKGKINLYHAKTIKDVASFL